MLLLALAQCRLVLQPYPPYVHNLVFRCIGPPSEPPPELPGYVFTIDKLPSAVLYVDGTEAKHLEYHAPRMLMQPGALTHFRTLLRDTSPDLSLDALDADARLFIEAIPDVEG